MIYKNNINKAIYLAIAVAFILSMAFAISEEVSVVGVVEQTKVGFVLTAADGSYAIIGGNLSNMIGKIIKATGTITQYAKGKAITLMSAEELANQVEVNKFLSQPNEC